MTTTTTRPGFNADPHTTIAFIFGMSVDETKQKIDTIMEALPIFDEAAWNYYCPITDFSSLAKSLGLPSSHTHQQPYDLVRLFPLPWRHSYQVDDEEDIIIYRILFILWFQAAMRNSDEIEPKDRLAELQLISENLVHYFGDSNAEDRRIQFNVAKDGFNWFKFTEGCFDLATGALIDRELPALREFEAETRRLRPRKEKCA